MFLTSMRSCHRLVGSTLLSALILQGNLMGRRQPGVLQALLPDVPVPPFTKTLDLKHINLWFGSGTINNPAHYDAVSG